MNKRKFFVGEDAPTEKKRKGIVIRLRGGREFRARLVMSILSKRRITITGIREAEEEPGLGRDEASFVRLLDKLTSGSRVEINQTGSALKLVPGFLVGGKIEHDVSRSGRGIGWFLEGLLPLAPFCGKPLELILLGATCAGPSWRSVDAIKHGPLVWLASDFKIECSLIIEKRQAVSSKQEQIQDGPGRIIFKCTPVRSLKPIHAVDAGLVAKIRGVAYATRVAPALANRTVAAARKTLDPYLADIHIITDAASKRDSAPGPGFGLALVATTTTQRSIVVDLDSSCLDSSEEKDTTTAKNPELLAKICVEHLLTQIQSNGIVDSLSAPLFLTLMALSQDDVSVAVLPSLSTACISRLRLLKIFFGTEFVISPIPLKHEGNSSDGNVIEEDNADDDDDATRESKMPVRCACIGAGLLNVAKAVT
eukprot:CAMPEP_0197288450 /NCGR_PEP_ID=MMETSP0890-20130614/5543_1 /TAXON_ID=44058 ORGANISM="Aureoumbra lagunensis, Strain CCMP1510" /NCGR_SAMPLE_ID=MMETSP0890 /ASSEMBLY_ACC=CAM_ASM_000533 /LENGTH=422 /DNA_ID=CAMNT_0042759187 /DNA_START=12 /DNA_END=1280 /DNA_ORIENTATION=-